MFPSRRSDCLENFVVKVFFGLFGAELFGDEHVVKILRHAGNFNPAFLRVGISVCHDDNQIFSVQRLQKLPAVRHEVAPLGKREKIPPVDFHRVCVQADGGKIAAEALGVDKILFNFAQLEAFPHLVVEDLVFAHFLLAEGKADFGERFDKRLIGAFAEVEKGIVDVNQNGVKSHSSLPVFPFFQYIIFLRFMIY